jgi:acetylornithine deacetylase/succinyl-diaminopimelate desuccinylase-like protein
MRGLLRVLLLFAATKAMAEPMTDAATRRLAVDILHELVEINTTESAGNVTRAAQAMQARFLAAGFAAGDIALVGADPRKQNLVVRLRGTGKVRPLLLLGHLDVVEARREDWTMEPFKFIEKDGFYYGRGTSDMKDGDAIMVATLIRLKREGFRADRDIILALTADEEGGDANGVAWLLANRRDLIDAPYALNPDGTEVDTRGGKTVAVNVGVTEKTYADFELTVKNAGGHSSERRPDNAIYELAGALGRLEHYEFPFELNAAVRAYYTELAASETGARAADIRGLLAVPPDPAAIARISVNPQDYIELHTYCVATRLDAGTANNALPQSANATVNCRILPGHEPEEVRQELIRVLAEPKLLVRYVDDVGKVRDDAGSKHGFAAPKLPTDVIGAVRKVAARMWPGVPVIPAMSVGSTDAALAAPFGLPVYQVSGEACEIGEDRSHGEDERIGVEAFSRGVDFYYRLMHALLSGD